MRTTLWEQRRRRSASRQMRCASRKPGRSLLCSSRAAGRARELALPSQRTVRVAVTVGTCSFSPPTVMHLRLLEEAKNFVSARCPRPYLRRDRAHSKHIFATSWLTAATSATRSDVRRCRWRRTRAMMGSADSSRRFARVFFSQRAQTSARAHTHYTTHTHARRHARTIARSNSWVLTAATSAPGLRSRLPCLHQGWAHASHICTGTGLTPSTSAPGLGAPVPTSAPGLVP